MKKHVFSVLTVLIFSFITNSSLASIEAKLEVETVRNWAVERMIAWSKPGRTLHPPAMESFDDGKKRYGFISDAAFKVAVSEKPVFSGSKGRVSTAALILAISMFESGYRKDVDLDLGEEGRGDRGRSWCLMQIMLGKPIHVDESGRRVTFVQVCKQTLSSDGLKTNKECSYVLPPGSRASTPSRIVLEGDGFEITRDQNRGHSGQDLIASRELCFTAGLRIIRRSFVACKRLPMEERLSAYASGNCENGRESSRRRMGAAIRWLIQNPSPVNDVQLVNLFRTPSYQSTQNPGLVFMAPVSSRYSLERLSQVFWAGRPQGT